jgi:osmoprotectant transport system substrate-binding protein
MLRSKSSALGIKSISDLGNAYKGGKNIMIGTNAEFCGAPRRVAWCAEDVRVHRSPLTRSSRWISACPSMALRDSQVEAAMVTSTDGRIIAFDVLVLNDDKAFFPIYLMTPVARKEALDKNPKLAGLLESLAAKLDSDTILKLNAAVDVDKKSVESVANGILKQQGLIKG